MSEKKGKLDFFIKPPIWFDAIVWTIALASVSAAIAVAFSPYNGEIWAFVLYAAGALSIVVSLYLVLTFGDIPERLVKNESVRRFVADFGFRSYVMAICSIVLNAFYAVFGTGIAVITRSVWLAALVWYHIFLALSRALVMFYLKKHRGKPDFEKYKLRAYVICGIALVAISIAIIPVILLVVNGANSYKFFGGVVVYVCVLALYTVVKLVTSLVTKKKAKKSGDPALLAVKSISLSDALISVFALQATMLTGFNDHELGAVMNPITGGAIAFIIAVMGVIMMIKGIRALKNGSNNADGTRSDAE